MLGNGRLEATCFDGTVRLCHIRGKFRKRTWINPGDIVLLGLRDYQDEKADVIHKYLPEEARTLKAYGEIPERVVIGNVQEGEEEEEGNVNFGAADGDSSEEDIDTQNQRAAKASEAQKKEEDLAEENWADALQKL